MNRFKGHFAFAIYDKKKRSLFIARDRLGIRPIFYTMQKGRFYFASEIKSIFCDDSIPRRIDPKWHHLARAQYLEAKSLLSGYLLSSQGDRVSVANSVEGRYPFLDHRVVEFGARIPPQHEILGLKEKLLLKRL